MLNLFLYITIIIIIMLSFKLFRNIKNNILLTIISSICIIQIIINPKICIRSALTGAKLFFGNVFPSLFPFLVICNIIIYSNGIDIYSKLFGNIICRPLRLPKQCSFVLIVSALCGYPLGAKYSAQLYEKNIIDINTYEKLLNVASNASPLFLIGAVGTSMLGNPKIGYLLLISNYISCFIMGIVLKNKKVVMYKYIPKNICKPELQNIGSIFQKSIEDSTKTSLMIGGFITIFSVITHILKNNILFKYILSKLFIQTSLKQIIESSILGLLEMTNGCSMISSISLNLLTKLIIISFLVSFSGLSIIMQVYSFTYKHKISIKKYIYKKLIQGFFSSLITALLYKILFNNSASTTIKIINTTHINNTNKYIPLIIIVLATPVLIKKLFRLFNFS